MQRYPLLATSFLIALAIPVSAAAQSDTTSNYSDAPAERWQDGLVSGNGKMGVLVFGQPRHERIVFNHELLYEFIGTETVPPADISAAMPEIKQLIVDGKYDQAHKLGIKTALENGHPDILWTDPYHPACALLIEQSFDGDTADYRRTTDYSSGQITVRWNASDIQYTRNTFVSRPDDVIATELTSSGDAKISFAVDLQHQLDPKFGSGSNKENRHTNNGILANLKILHPEKYDSLNTPVIEPAEVASEGAWKTFRVKYQLVDRGYEVITLVRHSGGTLRNDGRTIQVSGANKAEILSRVVPLEDYHNSQISVVKDLLESLDSYDQLLQQHTQDHAARFARVKLQLDKTGFRDGSNETLIREQKELDRVNPYLLEKVFNMGLYGLISSSGDNPPNLMGIWNGAWRPSWSGDFTLDANLNLQIAAANLANQPEAIDSYMTMLERVAPDWEVNAKNLFGCRGYLGGTRTSGRRNFHTHFGQWPGNHWTAAAGWLLSPCYEYYQCSGDEAFLKDRLLPMMVKTALFYEDFLDTYDQNEKFLIVPSYSPENRPSNTNPPSGVVANATMDIAVIRELMTHLITISKRYNVHEDKVATWQTILDKLPPYLINEDAALKEWSHPELSDRYDHRHVSHLYLAWPSLELTPDDQAIFAAARMAMVKRGRGNGSAHGLAHSALIATRLKQPELVYGNLLFLMKENYLYNSLFTSHNPGRIYNSDALHSIPAVVLEMLVYSRPGVIELLPACSDQLPKGSVSGVMCRTQAKVDSLEWDFPGGSVSATITSTKNQIIRIELGQNVSETKVDGKTQSRADAVEVEFQKGQARIVTFRFGGEIKR